jgi:hypothetical protein
MRTNVKCLSILTLLATAGAAFAQPVPPQPTPNVPVGNDLFGDPIQGPGAWPAGLSGATILIGLPENTINGRFGSNAIRHDALYSGPYAWSAGNTNEGDIDFNIGVAQPSDVRSFPTWSGWDAFRESDSGIPDPSLTANPLPAALNDTFRLQWPENENWGRLRLRNALQFALPNFAWGTHPARGVMIVTPAANGRDNVNYDRNNRATAMGTFYAHAHVTDDGSESTGRAYSPITGNFGGTGLYASTYVVGNRPGDSDEAVIDLSAAYFPYEQGWQGGFYDPSRNGFAGGWRVRNGFDAAAQGLDSSVVTQLDFFDASYSVTLPGVTPEDGMLFAQNVNDTNESYITGVLPTQTGWQILQRRDEIADAAGTGTLAIAPNDSNARFCFVFVPWDANNLIAGHYRGDGSPIRTVGNFSVSRRSEGEYAVRVDGKDFTDGALIVHGAGSVPNNPNVPNNTFYSYEWFPEAGEFHVQSRVLDTGNNTWGESYPLRDSSFYVMWIDFTNPASLGNTGPTCDYDYNQDENVDLTDAQLMAQVAAGVITADPSWLSGDLNGDENADLTDAQQLAAFVASGVCPI